MKKKLTTLERRALALCLDAIQTGSAEIAMEWRKSRDYGRQAVILDWGNEVCARTAGCGFDKESQALADCLRFLFPIGSEEYRKVWGGGGRGFYSMQDRLNECGWTIEKTASGKTFNAYRLTRKETA